VALAAHGLRWLAWTVGFIILAGLVGCSPVADRDQSQSSDSILREMVANDRQQIESLQQRVARLDDRITEMEHNGVASAGKSLTALEARVSKLESQAVPPQPNGPSAPVPGAATGTAPGTAAPGGIPGTPPPPAAGAADDGSSGEETASAAPPAPVPPPTVAPAPKPATARPPAAAPVPATAAPSWRELLDQELAASHSDAGAKLYRAGLTDLKAGKYSQGVARMQDLQRKYPKSELSEPAEFFSGNGLFELGKYDQAILQFNDLTMRFPNGHFATPALLREAQAFVKINDPIDARLTLQKLLTEHPDAPEAPMAKSMMNTLASG